MPECYIECIGPDAGIVSQIEELARSLGHILKAADPKRAIAGSHYLETRARRVLSNTSRSVYFTQAQITSMSHDPEFDRYFQ
jgi:hypothetical protein